LKKYFLIVFLFLFYFTLALAKPIKNKFYLDPPRQAKIGVETNFYFGKIIKHTKLFKTPISSYSYAYEIGVNFYNFGEKPWQRKWKYPMAGLSFIHGLYGDKQYFGSSYSILPYLNIWIFRSKVVDAYFRMGFGIGYVTKHYNEISNPGNNVIGSSFNNITQFKLGLDWKINEHVFLNTCGSFTHWSNAKIQNPNLGINLATLTLGLKIFPVLKSNSYQLEKPGKPKKRNEGMIKYSIGISEMGKTPGGPKFMTHTGTASYNRYTSAVNKIFGGFSVSYESTIYNQLKYSEIYKGENQHWKATSLSVFIGDEMVFGKVGLFAMLGFYMHYPTEVKRKIYFKLGANYYYASLGKNKAQKLFLGVNLKAHGFVASMIEFSQGITF
jgi:hypothetical protein